MNRIYQPGPGSGLRWGPARDIIFLELHFLICKMMTLDHIILKFLTVSTFWGLPRSNKINFDRVYLLFGLAYP